MWFLGFCSPFRYQQPSTQKVGRIIMYSQVFALFLVYTLIISLYKFIGKKVVIKNDNEQIRKQGVTFKRKDRDQQFLQKNFKEWYLNYFGLHSVIVGACIMYSPYIAQFILTGVHFLLFIAATVLYFFKKNKGSLITWIYNILMILATLINIVLLFSATMGVGAAGYDESAQICYLQRTI